MAPAASVGIYLTGIAGLGLGSTPLVFLLAFLIFYMTINANYQISKKVVHAGGYYAYTSTGLGKKVGLFAGLFYALGDTAGLAAFGFLQFGVFLYYLFPSFSSIPYIWILFATATTIFITTFTYLGIKPNLMYVTITGIIEMLILYIASIYIIVVSGSANTLSVFTPTYVAPHYGNLFLGIIYSITAFTGVGSIITLGEEAKEPRKSIRKAILWILPIAAIPMILTTYAFTIAFGPNKMNVFATLSDPGVLILKSKMGDIFALIFSLFVLNSALSVGIAEFNAASRTYYGMARDGFLPKFLNYTHPKHGTPTHVILVMLIIAFVMAIGAVLAFGVYLGFFVLAGVAAIAAVAPHFLVNINMPFYLHKLKEKLTVGNVVTWIILPLLSAFLLALVFYFSYIPLPAYPYSLEVLAFVLIIIIAAAVVLYASKKNSEKLNEDIKSYD
jgi:amino acid transporter